MTLRKIFGIKKHRKFPILRDETGKSLRKRCFECLDDGMSPAEVMEELGAKKSTVYTYHRDWKKQGPTFEKGYDFVKNTLLQKDPEEREYNLDLFSRAFGISKEELENILSKPYGLRRLLHGKFRFPAHKDADRKRQAVMELALFIDNHLMAHGGNVGDMLFALQQWMKTNQQHREEEDSDIEHENKATASTREALTRIVEAEQEGRVKLDKLSDHEIDTILSWGPELQRKNVERAYWFRIVGLIGEGLTPTQGREKIYQDLVDKGDVKGAAAMRAYQDIVHPLKPDNQTKQPPPSQPPPPAEDHKETDQVLDRASENGEGTN